MAKKEGNSKTINKKNLKIKNKRDSIRRSIEQNYLTVTKEKVCDKEV